LTVSKGQTERLLIGEDNHPLNLIVLNRLKLLGDVKLCVSQVVLVPELLVSKLPSLTLLH